MQIHKTLLQASTLLFENLEHADLQWIYSQMRPRHFRTGELICHEGEEGNSLFIIQSGAAQVVVGPLTEARSSLASSSLARLRRGDVVGEMSLLTGEPRSASVVASMPTTVLELTHETFAIFVAKYPAIVTNLTRILSRRLAHTNTWQSALQHQHEAIALLIDQHSHRFVQDILAATQSASPHNIGILNLTLSPAEEQHEREIPIEERLALLDDLLITYTTVIVVVNSDTRDVQLLLRQMDRIVAVIQKSSAASVAANLGEVAEQIDVVLLSEEQQSTPQAIEGMQIIRTCNLHQPGKDIAWLGRHLSRTKLGLAFGAGGAKGYAHIAVLYALEQAGYTVDYVAGSSIGAMVGCWLAMGKRAGEVETTMRSAFTPENVAATFKLSLTGMSTGYTVMQQICRETTGNGSFADLLIPLVVMTVDLNTRQSVPITEGALWEALMAGIALPGMFPPYQRAEYRLVDGLTLIPVPVNAVRDAGADIIVSVNLISREISPAASGRSSSSTNVRMLDTLLEVMDLAQMDASIRSAALADVVITPHFGSTTWRDFHLADQLMAAGREAVEEQLATLGTLARPQPTIY